MQTGDLASQPQLYSDDEDEFSTPQPMPLSEKESIDQDLDEFDAVEALRQLKHGGSTPKVSNEATLIKREGTRKHYKAINLTRRLSDGDAEKYKDDNNEDDNDEKFYDTTNELAPTSSGTSTSSGASGKRKRLLNTALQAYNNSPAIKYGVEMVERATQPMVNIIEQKSLEWRRKRRLSKATEMFPDDVAEYTTRAIGPAAPLVRATIAKSYASKKSKKNDGNAEVVSAEVTSSSVLKSVSSGEVESHKSQKLPSISEALARGNELSLSMSIESRKRLNTCLQLLMLANKQLSTKVVHLQDLVNKEQELIRQKQAKRREQYKTDDATSETADDDEIFHDARDLTNTDEIKQEIVGTVKKVVTFISKYAGQSLPEPERSNVRQELLKLPTKWATQASNSILGYNTNGKVLVLAHESLEMVSSVMSVFDESLAKAEVWIKKKQEKQLAKQAILNNSLKRQRETE